MSSTGRNTSELAAAAAPKVAPRPLSPFQCTATTSMHNQFLLPLLVISSTCCLVIHCSFHTGVSSSLLLSITFLGNIIGPNNYSEVCCWGCHFVHVHTDWFIQIEICSYKLSKLAKEFIQFEYSFFFIQKKKSHLLKVYDNTKE